VGYLLVAMWFCGTAIHFWSAYLAWRHWGVGWGIATLAVPGIGDIVAIVAAFWWGEWAYLALVAVWIVVVLGASLVRAVTKR